MKRLSFTHVLFGILILTVGFSIWNDHRPLPPSKIEWRTDYISALSEAKRTGKLLFVEFFATWCSACRSLDRTTLRDADVEEALERFVAVRVDADLSPAELDLKYNVSGIPALHVVSPDGEIWASSVGVIGPNDLLKLLRTAR